MFRVMVLGLATVAALLAPIAATAQPPGGRARLQRDRVQLEREVRERLASVVKERLGLTDEQMSRLSEVNQRYDLRRRDLVRRDRDVRIAIRDQIMGSAAPNDERVGQLLLDTQRIARERLDLLESEQAELARFLTPVQRAKYLGLQEQMRQRIEEFRPRPPFLEERGRGQEALPGRRGRRPPPG